jgi:hypothetical protein
MRSSMELPAGLPLISPQRNKHEDNKAKRKEAAEWLQAVTDTPVPSAEDHDFRASLKDGVLLCRTLNAVVPGSITRVSPWMYQWGPQLSPAVAAFAALHAQAGRPGPRLLPPPSTL